MNRKLCVLIAALACAPAAHGNIFSWIYRRPLVSLLCSTALGYAVGTQTAHPLAIACAAGTGMAGIIAGQKRELQMIVRSYMSINKLGNYDYVNNVFSQTAPRYKTWFYALSARIAERNQIRRLKAQGYAAIPWTSTSFYDITYSPKFLSSRTRYREPFLAK